MNNYKLILSFFLILIFITPAKSTQSILLNQLFTELSKTDNLKDADLLEKKIWAVWNKHPKNIILTDRLKFGTELMYVRIAHPVSSKILFLNKL